jgi:hypothetical protein
LSERSRTPRIYSSRRASSSAIVSALIMPRSATTHTRVMSKRRRNRSITGITVVTSAVLPGHISEHTGRPSPSSSTARIICRRFRAVVLAVAVLAQRWAAGALEVETRGVEWATWLVPFVDEPTNGLFEKPTDKDPSRGRDDDIARKSQQKQRSPSQLA